MIAATGLVKSYGEARVLDGVDLVTKPGETVALLGPNGAGKSTTIRLLLGIEAPDAGRVRLLGLDPQSAVRAGRVGTVLQDGALPGGARVIEVVGLFAALAPRPRPVPEVLRQAGIAGLARRRTDRLSGGEAQRVRLAAALVGDPDLLVLDEPTVALDVAARRQLWDTLHGLAAEGRSLLFSTHYLEEADAMADRVVVLAGGRIRADGSPAAVKGILAGRVVSFSIAHANALAAEPVRFAALPGVERVKLTGGRVALTTRDSDRTLRALLAAAPEAAEIEVAGRGLEEAFLALTATDGGQEGSERLTEMVAR